MAKTDKIKHKTIINDYNIGGLRLTDIKSFLTSIKACWVKRLILNKNSFYETILNPFGGRFIFECNLMLNDISKVCKTNTFLKDILTSWFSIVQFSNIDTNEVRKHIIWNNSEIKIQQNTIYWNKWHEKKI